MSGRDLLSPFERRLIIAFAEAAIPKGERLKISVADIREPWLAKFEELLSSMPSEQRAGLRSLLRLIEVSPFLFSLRLSRFTRMSLDDREAFLSSWESSRWLGRRLYLLMLKAVVGMCFCSMDEVERELGYDRMCLGEAQPSALSGQLSAQESGTRNEEPGSR
ncbi:MAG: hypothetical protein HYT87_02430 [Nitrospirae bacterium]|nr:hypothetical protein [Nitrospirota bacterium]